MSTATSRLRRAGVGGVAAAVVLGTALAGAGTANAWTGAPSVTGTADAATTIIPGATNQPLAGAHLTVNGWQIGDTITLTLDANTTGACAAGAGIGFAAAPTVTAAATPTPVTGEVRPTFTTALSSTGGPAGACAVAGIQDILTITFTNVDAKPAATEIGSVLNVASTAKVADTPTAGPVSLTATPAGVGAVPAPVTLNVATLADVAVAATPSTGAPGATVSAPDITVTEYTGGKVGNQLTLTLSSGTWASVGTLTTPAGVTVTVPATAGGASLVWGLSGATPVATPGAFKLSGATVTLPATHAAVRVTTTVAGGGVVAPLPLPYLSAISQSRVAGDDRYATAAAAFRAVPGAVGGGEVVLATGENFPDALAANALAGQLGTGILLTKTASLPEVTREALIDAANGPFLTVYVVGGPNAVSAKVVDAIRALGTNPSIGGELLNPVRIIRVYGADRVKTAEAVAARITLPGVETVNTTSGRTAIVATGWNYPDALTVAPASFASHLPLLLTRSDGSLSAATLDALAAASITNVIIVGGTDVVSAAVETQLKASYNVLRLSGATRYDTAAAIGTWELQTPAATNNGGLSWADGDVRAYLATGTNFPDALAGGPLAGSFESPVFLSALSASEIGVLKARTADQFSSVVALGGIDVVPNAARTAAAVATAG